MNSYLEVLGASLGLLFWLGMEYLALTRRYNRVRTADDAKLAQLGTLERLEQENDSLRRQLKDTKLAFQRQLTQRDVDVAKRDVDITQRKLEEQIALVERLKATTNHAKEVWNGTILAQQLDKQIRLYDEAKSALGIADKKYTRLKNERDALLNELGKQTRLYDALKKRFIELLEELATDAENRHEITLDVLDNRTTFNNVN